MELHQYGLLVALQNFALRIQQQFGMTCVVQAGARAPARLKNTTAVHLFRIAQEALANVLRHAHACHASVILLRQPHDVTLLVEDDGQGFDPAIIQEKGDKCIGLIGMKERVALLGGDLLIQSAPRGGTTLLARIPLSDDDHADTDLDRR